jgi:hypothetical protein
MAPAVRTLCPAFPGFPAPPLKGLAYSNGSIVDYNLEQQKVNGDSQWILYTAVLLLCVSSQ